MKRIANQEKATKKNRGDGTSVDVTNNTSSLYDAKLRCVFHQIFLAGFGVEIGEIENGADGGL